MNVSIIAEPQYVGAIWYAETMAGLSEKASELKIGLRILTEEDMESIEGGVLLIGTTPSWMERLIRRAARRRLLTVVVSCCTEGLSLPASYIVPDYAGAMTALLSHYSECGCGKTALYGVNAYSYADRLKCGFFDEKDVYYNDSDLDGCFEGFLPRMEGYGAVVCANSIAAVSLLAKLRERGFTDAEIPALSAFGQSAFSAFLDGRVTFVTLEHRLLGQQAVSVYRYLAKQSFPLHVTVRIPCSVTPKTGTGDADAEAPFRDERHFYNDPEVKRIEKLERLFSSCDMTDLAILSEMPKKTPYRLIAEKVFLSENAVKYRIGRLISAGDFASKSEMLSLIAAYRLRLDCACRL